MIGFLTSATATWALWKMYDAWVDKAAVAGASPAAGRAIVALDPHKLAVALQDLDELETPPAQALAQIAESARRSPQRVADSIAEQLHQLPAEQRAAVALALLLAAQRARQ
jgi:hypothetical protein